jgi:NNP family nitrate/nitrite transporter-like MFS transporter
MGIYGAGNSGAAVNKFVAPALLVAFGWTMVPQVYAAIMLGTVICSGCSATAIRRIWCRNTKFSDQLKALKDPQGAEVLPVLQHRVRRLRGAEPVDGAVLRRRVRLDIRVAACWPPASRCPAACCAPSAAGCRQVRRAQRDLVGDVGELDLPVPAELPADRLHHQTTVDGPTTFHIGLNVYAFTALMFVLGIAWAFGKASVFKYISDDYPTNIGTISGIVGLAGGLGGFVLPIMFGALMDLTGIRSSAFMLMYGVVWVSLIWMYWTEVRGTEVMGHATPPPRLPPSESRTIMKRTTPTTPVAPQAPTSPTGAPRTSLLGIHRQEASPTATSGSRSPPCSAASRSGACGASSPCRCSTWASRSPRPSCSR